MAIYGDSLQYFSCSKLKECLFIIPLRCIKKVAKIKAGVTGVYSFRVIFLDRDEDLVLRASRLEDANKWVDGIQLHMRCWEESRQRQLNKTKRRKSRKRSAESTSVTFCIAQIAKTCCVSISGFINVADLLLPI